MTKVKQNPAKQLGWSTKNIALSSAALCAGIGFSIYYILHKKQHKQIKPAINGNDTKYILVSMSGEPMTFTDKQVLEIKRLYEDGTSPIAIAEEFDISVVMVCRIVYSINF